MISIDFMASIDLFGTKGTYSAMEVVDNDEVRTHLNELTERYTTALMTSNSASLRVSFMTKDVPFPDSLSDLIHNIWLETDGETYLNIDDDGASEINRSQTLAMTEGNVRAAVASVLTNAYLRNQRYLETLENEKEARS